MQKRPLEEGSLRSECREIVILRWKLKLTLCRLPLRSGEARGDVLRAVPVEGLDLDALVDELGSQAVNGHALGELDGAALVDRLADDVHDAAQGALANWHRDRRASRSSAG